MAWTPDQSYSISRHISMQEKKKMMRPLKQPYIQNIVYNFFYTTHENGCADQNGVGGGKTKEQAGDRA